MRADRADFLDGNWWLTNPRLMSFDIDGMELPDTAVRVVDLPGNVPFPELTEKPRDIRIAEQKDNAHLSSREMLRKMRTSRAGSMEDRYDFWYRIAAPWACLVITLFSIPAGITTGRQSVFKGILLVLVTFFSFYAQVFRREGADPPLPRRVAPEPRLPRDRRRDVPPPDLTALRYGAAVSASSAAR